MRLQPHEITGDQDRAPPAKIQICGQLSTQLVLLVRAVNLVLLIRAVNLVLLARVALLII